MNVCTKKTTTLGGGGGGEGVVKGGKGSALEAYYLESENYMAVFTRSLSQLINLWPVLGFHR